MNKRKQKQIRQMISTILKKMEMYSEEAENLVFGTGLIESNYDYLRQWNNGVARSWWQIEPGMTGAKDTLENYLKYRQRLMWNCVDIAQVHSTAFLPTAIG